MNAIRDMRIRSGLTQEAAARFLGVERSTVAKWETSNYPKSRMLPKIAELYKCEIGELLGERPKGRPRGEPDAGAKGRPRGESDAGAKGRPRDESKAGAKGRPGDESKAGANERPKE